MKLLHLAVHFELADAVTALFEDLLSFQHEKKTHAHLEALLLPIERTLHDHPSPHPG